MVMNPRSPAQLSTIGWREWVRLPELGIFAIKAKVDTGARTSALHAIDMHYERHRGAEVVRFKVHPLQRNAQFTIVAEAVVIEHRRVRSSGGHDTLRPVIVTPLELVGQRWEIELTLVSRDAMGFRMLLGRQALRGRVMVDPGHSFLSGRPARDALRRAAGKRSQDPPA
jgi:hypothetical protein